MMTKLLKGALTRIAATAIAAVSFTPVAFAVVASSDMDNPVTGETETYTYRYVGSGTWTASDWVDANGDALAAAPGTDNSNLWDSMLINGTESISVAKLNGWTLQLGVFGGASVTVVELGFWTGSESCFAAVDDTSSLTISATTGNNWNNTVKFYVANSDGITFTSAFAPANPNGTGNIHYYLKGSGSVAYLSTLGGAVGHVIKQADVKLTGTSQVSSKTLVSFASTDKTFTAAATIKVLNGSDAEVATRALSTIGTTATLTTDNAVGTCELVQTSTGIVLYWVDGDPNALPAPTVYLPSININFTSGTALSTSSDVGLTECAVPGTAWNNLTVANNATLSALNAVTSSGTTWATAASVTITGTRGSYQCSNLTATSDLRHGYIDENGNNPTPTVTVSGIPFEKYHVVVYTATDTPSTSFGYITINGKDYTYVNDALTEGTTAWGASGAADSAEPIAEGTNVLISPVIIGPTLTVVGHRGDGARGCIAAIQIVEFVPEVVEGVDLVIPVMGDTTYTVDEAKTLSGTVYVVGNGTLTLDGSAKITASTIDVSKDVVLNVNADRLDADAYVGTGTVVFDGVKPTANKGWTDDSAWLGTIWVKNIPTSSNERKDWALQNYGNANSTLRFTNVNLFFPNNTTTAFPGTVDLDGTGMNVCDGYGGSIATFARLTGSGTLSTANGSSNGNGLTINDASEFTGTITLTKYKVIIGSSTGTSASGVLQIDSGAVATVPSGTTWTAPGGFVVNGTLNDNGTLASSATPAVTGSGTVVFTSRIPTPADGANETRWWKNANWTGSVQIKDVTNLVGMSNVTGTYIDFNQYGHADSIVELNNVTGWVNPNYTCTPKFKVTGTLYLSNGYSGANNAFKVGTLLGSGTISGDGSADKAVFNVTEDASEFTGTFGLNNKCIVFGSTIPDTLTAGTIYVSEGAVATMQQSSGTWWAVGGIKVDGTLRATGRDKWGGGTAITLGDTGVLELTSTANTEDYADYSGVTGTGTIKYFSTAGWRTFPSDDAKMPATTLTIQTELADSLIITKNNNGTTTIGNLAGSKNIRSDWSSVSGGANARTLTVTQSKDTEWSGIFVNNRITQFNVVDAGGTLTLSGTQTANIPANITGSVNLTGTWVGDATVAGTFGGTGTLTGNLTLSDGATIKVNDISDSLAVSGSLTATGAITIELPEGANKGMLITTGSKPDISGATFTTKIGGVEKKLKVTAVAGGLKVGVQSLLIRIR